jgi:small-conductance mechanosensitive channel
MNEFRVVGRTSSVRQRGLVARLSLWGMVAGLLGIVFFASDGPRSTVQHFSGALLFIFGLIAVGAIVLVFLLIFRDVWEKGISGWSFILTDANLIKKREGWPDITIPLDNITGLYVRKKYLEVESSILNRRIIIPKEIERFDTLQKALSKYKEPVSRPSDGVLLYTSALVYAICCALVLWSRILPITLWAATLGVASLEVQTYYLYASIRRNPKTRSSGLTFISLAWLGAILIAFFRIIHL